MPPREASMPQPWPAVSPDQTNDIESLPIGAVRKCPTCVSLDIFYRVRFEDIADPGISSETHPVENILPRRKIFEQHFGSEVAIRQRVRRCDAKDGLEAFNRGALHLHARWPVGPRPHHSGIRNSRVQ